MKHLRPTSSECLMLEWMVDNVCLHEHTLTQIPLRCRHFFHIYKEALSFQFKDWKSGCVAG